MEALDALCATHPERTADATCDRCGLFTCADCRKAYQGRPLCLPCHAALWKEKPSTRAVIALAFGFIGFLGFLPGLVALYLGQRELKAIQAGESPPSGEGFATMARDLGYLHAAMLAGILMVWAARSSGMSGSGVL